MKDLNLKFYDVIRRPVISEKSTVLGSNRQYVFVVDMKSTKSAIKAAIEKIFSVKIESVQTMIRKGKTKRFKGIVGHQSDIKKAIVTLEKGAEIDITGGVK
jgi:large subunit ribosomal protein L23